MIRPKRQFIASLREHQEVSDVFQVVQKSLAVGRANKPYLRVTLSDKTGTIEARVWDGANQIEPLFAKGDLVLVQGRVTSYQGGLQFNIDAVEKLAEREQGEVSWTEFLPSAARPLEELWEELWALLASVRNPHLCALLRSFAADGAFRQHFINCPAAKGMHHVYLGGLLEHTLGVVRLGAAVGAHYPVNRDILLTGAFLHDVGKVRELTYRTGFDYTDEGRLLGHLIIGTQMLRDRAGRLPGFPPALLLHLEHLILSHHGEYEWGSPKRPKTLEALVLHALDDLDAKLCGARDLMAKVEGADGDWSAFSKALGRFLYRPTLGGPAFGEEEPLEGLDALEKQFPEAEQESEASRGRAGTEERCSKPEPLRRAKKLPPGQGDLGF